VTSRVVSVIVASSVGRVSNRQRGGAGGPATTLPDSPWRPLRSALRGGVPDYTGRGTPRPSPLPPAAPTGPALAPSAPDVPRVTVDATVRACCSSQSSRSCAPLGWSSSSVSLSSVRCAPAVCLVRAVCSVAVFRAVSAGGSGSRTGAGGGWCGGRGAPRGEPGDPTPGGGGEPSGAARRDRTRRPHPRRRRSGRPRPRAMAFTLPPAVPSVSPGSCLPEGAGHGRGRAGGGAAGGAPHEASRGTPHRAGVASRVGLPAATGPAARTRLAGGAGAPRPRATAVTPRTRRTGPSMPIASGGV
jgi:hypothetical protein